MLGPRSGYALDGGKIVSEGLEAAAEKPEAVARVAGKAKALESAHPGAVGDTAKAVDDASSLAGAPASVPQASGSGSLPSNTSSVRVSSEAPSKITPKEVAGVHPPKSASATFTNTQLEKKWKHAPDFGITTTKRNPTTLAQYQSAIVNHLDDAATIEKGTYLYVKDSKVFFNPSTNNVVVLDKNGVFVSGWKLTPGTPQWTKLVNDGVLR